MKTTDNVQRMFSMDEEQFMKLHSRLGQVVGDPDQLLAALNTPDAKEDSGSTSLVAGTIVALVSTVGVFFVSVQGGWISAGLIATAVIGALFAINGLRMSLSAFRIISKAVQSRNDLESDDGFLWRFENMLLDWDGDLDAGVSVTLATCCLSSRKQSFANSRYSLRAYWFWVSALQGRMEDAASMNGWTHTR